MELAIVQRVGGTRIYLKQTQVANSISDLYVHTIDIHVYKHKVALPKVACSVCKVFLLYTLDKLERFQKSYR